MNLIGNSCVASFLTRDYLNEEYKNPFCWSSMDFTSTYLLIKYFNKIDFNNVRFEIVNNFCVAIIDNLITVKYIHYLQDLSLHKVTFEKSNVKYDNILDYAKNKYFSRLEKIKKENPTFILAAGYWQEYYMNDIQIKSIMNLDSDYDIIICMPSTKINVLQSTKNIKILNHSFPMGIDGTHQKIAEFLAKNIFNINKTIDLKNTKLN